MEAVFGTVISGAMNKWFGAEDDSGDEIAQAHARANRAAQSRDAWRLGAIVAGVLVVLVGGFCLFRGRP